MQAYPGGNTKRGKWVSLESIYIIDISIYLDLPREEQIDTDVQIVDIYRESGRPSSPSSLG